MQVLYDFRGNRCKIGERIFFDFRNGNRWVTEKSFGILLISYTSTRCNLYQILLHHAENLTTLTVVSSQRYVILATTVVDTKIEIIKDPNIDLTYAVYSAPHVECFDFHSSVSNFEVADCSVSAFHNCSTVCDTIVLPSLRISPANSWKWTRVVPPPSQRARSTL